MTRDHRGQSMRPAPTVPSYSEDGKAVDVGKGARGWTFSRSNHCYVSDEDRVNRLPGRGRGAAVHATEMTSPVVTLGAEVANPWRARCPERGTPGSEGGVGKHRVAVRPAPTLLLRSDPEVVPEVRASVCQSTPSLAPQAGRQVASG